MRLTARSVEAAKPQPGKRLEIADHVVRGLSLRVSAAGTKSWAVRYRVEGGLQRRLTLGAFPAVTLEKARAAVTATYLRHRFDVEKRAALSAWSTLLMRIVLTDAREHVGACVAVATHQS